MTAIRYSDEFDFFFDGDATMVAFECLANGEAHAFFESSQVTFRDGRIYSIDEYERTKG